MRKRYLVVFVFVMAVLGAVVFVHSFGQRPLAAYMAQLHAQGEALSFAELAAGSLPTREIPLGS